LWIGWKWRSGMLPGSMSHQHGSGYRVCSVGGGGMGDGGTYLGITFGMVNRPDDRGELFGRGEALGEDLLECALGAEVGSGY